MATELNVDKFTQQVEAMHGRIAQLYEHANKKPELSPNVLLGTSFKELGCASEELNVAAEQLIQFNEELAATRAAVEAERQRYQDLFEFAPDAYLVTDSVGTILEANRAASTLLSISSKYLVGKPLLVFVPEPERHRFRSELHRLHQDDRTQELVTRLSPRTSKFFDAALTIGTVRDSEGKLVSLRICIRDITERQRALALLDSNDHDISFERQRHFYAKGENIPLYHDSIWLVCKGCVKLSTACENGSEALVGLAGPQMVFGSSLTSLQTYQATAIGKDVQLVSISLTEIATTPGLGNAILPKINRRLQQTESFLAISRQLRLQNRLHHFLLLLKEEFGQSVESGTRLSIRLTHSDLASACCTTRVTMTRMLSKLQQQGIITFDRKSHMIVKDVVKEKELINLAIGA
ncbi:MAG: PAS domain S-box protein [Aphanothece sp. CMT-3BRIN-NPC111]|jgi:PAS domain S-box-containing protein|nr:PAS domain S-box protein [Aphanothece sp. CMT-3BRIN-NPC111]